MSAELVTSPITARWKVESGRVRERERERQTDRQTDRDSQRERVDRDTQRDREERVVGERESYKETQTVGREGGGERDRDKHST